MPYQLTAEPALFRLVFIDTITPHELISLADDIAALERTRTVAPNRLTDLTQVAAPHLTFTAMLDFAECRKAQQLPNRVKSAIVAPEPVHYGFARMFQTLNDHPLITIQIFRSLAEAEAWVATEA